VSKSVDEVIKLLKDNPKDWLNNSGIDYYYNSLISKDECLKIDKHGNTCYFSVITLTCGNNEVLTTWFDRFKLENAVSEWFRKIGLKELEDY
jgi:hypothetical protein